MWKTQISFIIRLKRENVIGKIEERQKQKKLIYTDNSQKEKLQ